MFEKNKSGMLTHYLRYASGSVLILLAGFVSLPITTRLLTTEQFGVIGYWETFALLLAAILKMGSGDAMMRFYPHDASPAEMIRFSTNFILLPSLIAMVGWVFSLIVLVVLILWGRIDSPLVALLAFGNVLCVIWSSNILWLSGTREQSGFNVATQVIGRWLVVGFTLLILYFYTATAAGAFAGRIAANLLVLIFLLTWVFKNTSFDFKALDFSYAMQGFNYGFPLAMKELSLVIMGFIDRLMLKAILNDYSVVGVYSIGYALASYVEQAIGTALGQALTPVANRLYTTEGAAAVKQLKKKILKNLVQVCMGLALGIFLAGEQFVYLVTGADKVESAKIFVIAASFFLLRPILSTMGMGLLLERRSKTILWLTFFAAAVNIGLNIVLIPMYGATGALAATCFSDLLLHLMIYVACPTQLRSLPDGLIIAKSLFILLISLGGFNVIFHGLALSNASHLILSSGWLLFTYALPIVLIDSGLRLSFISKINSLVKL